MNWKGKQVLVTSNCHYLRFMSMTDNPSSPTRESFQNLSLGE